MEEKLSHPGGKLRRDGPSQCSETDLMAIVLNTGTKKLSARKVAEELLDKFGGTIWDLQDKALYELMEVEGIGPTKATQVAAVVELCFRFLKHYQNSIYNDTRFSDKNLFWQSRGKTS